MSSAPYWREEELTLLQEKYAGTPNSELLEMFPGRTLPGLRVKASSLNLRKDPRYCEFGKPHLFSGVADLPDVEKAYLAGIIDGEGCLRMEQRPRKGKPPVYAYYVQVSNTSPQLLDWLNARVPGRIYTRKYPTKPSHRDCYAWVLSGANLVKDFLFHIEPYLVIKKRQAQILMDGYVHLDLEARNAMFQEMRSLKKTS